MALSVIEGIEYKVPEGLALCETWASCPAVGLGYSGVKDSAFLVIELLYSILILYSYISI